MFDGPCAAAYAAGDGTEGVMKKVVFTALVLAVMTGLIYSPAFAETAKPETGESEAAREDAVSDGAAGEEKSGGVFDFLPFVGDDGVKVAPETLKPSPKPRKIKPKLEKKEVDQLRGVAERWVLASEYTEPTIRVSDDGEYYRDYIVFANKYEAKVLRGKSADVPFIGQVYINGDYFRTRSHETADEARADFKFKYQIREFRIVFNRIEKWEFSIDSSDEPFVFVERWEFDGIQSRAIRDASEAAPLPAEAESESFAPALESKDG